MCICVSAACSWSFAWSFFYSKPPLLLFRLWLRMSHIFLKMHKRRGRLPPFQLLRSSLLINCELIFASALFVLNQCSHINTIIDLKFAKRYYLPLVSIGSCNHSLSACMISKMHEVSGYVDILWWKISVNFHACYQMYLSIFFIVKFKVVALNLLVELNQIGLIPWKHKGKKNIG